MFSSRKAYVCWYLKESIGAPIAHKTHLFKSRILLCLWRSRSLPHTTLYWTLNRGWCICNGTRACSAEKNAISSLNPAAHYYISGLLLCLGHPAKLITMSGCNHKHAHSHIRQFWSVFGVSFCVVLSFCNMEPNQLCQFCDPQAIEYLGRWSLLTDTWFHKRWPHFVVNGLARHPCASRRSSNSAVDAAHAPVQSST